MTRPVLHLFCGKMAAGKSTLARRLAAEEGALLFSEDLWLSRLYPGEIQGLPDYLDRAAKLKAALGPQIVELLGRGLSVVLDFPGNTPAQRRWFRELLDASRAEHLLHVLEVPEAQCKAQLRQRNAERPEGSKESSEAEFDFISSFFRPPEEAEGFRIERHGPA